MGGTTSVERGSPAQKRGGTASKGRGTSGKDEVSPEFKPKGNPLKEFRPGLNLIKLLGLFSPNINKPLELRV